MAAEAAALSAGQSFAGRVVIVFGGTSGIGSTTALAFARAGARVAVVGRDAARGAAVVAAMRDAGGDGLALVADVRDASAVARAVDTCVQTLGSLDCAFNNAGWEGVAGRAGDLAPDDWLRMIDVKLNGVWRCMKFELAALAGRGGSIVNMAGNWGYVGCAGYASYCAAAHGIMGLTRAAALDYARDGIRINAVCPGAVDAPMLERMVGGDRSLMGEFGKSLAIGRICTREEVAAAVLWLASADASYVTGQGLLLNGGG